jgi:hypothetical protein
MTIPGSARRTLIAQAIMLLSHYGFDTKPHTTAERMGHWLDAYEADWIRTAIIEALYQGRYKAVSVEHILNLWQKRGRPSPHFTGDFERIICRKLPEWYMNISSIESDAAVNEPAAAELPVFATTAAAPPTTPPAVTPGVQRWRQLAQFGQAAAHDEGMIARLRSFAYLDVTAPPLSVKDATSEAVNEPPASAETEPEPLTEDAIDALPSLEDGSEPAAASVLPEDQGTDGAGQDSDGSESGAELTLELELTPEPELILELDAEAVITAASDSDMNDSEMNGAAELTPASGSDVNHAAELTPELEPAAAVTPATDERDPVISDAAPEAIAHLAITAPTDPADTDPADEDSDRPAPATANLLLLSQTQTVQPRPLLDLPNPKRVGPTFRSGIRTFVPALELSPFLARLLQFYATLPAPEAVDPCWAPEPLPVSLERS